MIKGAWPGADGNILLAHGLSGRRPLLDAASDPVELDAGTTLWARGTAIDAVYWPLSAAVSVHERGPGGEEIEICLIGREGMLGWDALLGPCSAAHTARVQVGGRALRIAAGHLNALCAADPGLMAALLRYVHLVTLQMSHAVVAQLHRSVLCRVSRWLLMLHDRVLGEELVVLHEAIGACLGVRRASVTDALHILEGDRLIRCHRGRVQVRDRPGLEDVAGDAYGAFEQQYRALIGPFGKSRKLAAGEPPHAVRSALPLP